MTPENGALISVLARRAAASATAASATRRLFSASSFAWPEMKLLLREVDGAVVLALRELEVGARLLHFGRR